MGRALLIIIIGAMIISVASEKGPTSTASAPVVDLATDQNFLKGNPKYPAAIRELIVSSGYDCPRVANLWLQGRSPHGIKLEALCGPIGSANAYPELHYSVYPDRFQVIACKPFGVFGGGCE
jgi:hypothetical protein